VKEFKQEPKGVIMLPLPVLA